MQFLNNPWDECEYKNIKKLSEKNEKKYLEKNKFVIKYLLVGNHNSMLNHKYSLNILFYGSAIICGIKRI